MEISGSGPLRPVGSLRPVSPSVTASAKPTAPGDTVELSDAARRAADGPGEANPLRAKRLAEIRAAIESGNYETTERLEAALSRFLAEVGAVH